MSAAVTSAAASDSCVSVPRPRRSKSIRKFTFQGSFDYVTDAPAIELQSKEASGLFRIEFQSSDQFSTEYSHEFELLPNRFAIAPGVIVPAGGYSYSTSRVSVLARPAAPGVRAAQRVDRLAVRRHEVRRLVLRTMGCDAAVFAGAQRDAGVGIAAVR